MLLTISTTHRPATDLGYLLYAVNLFKNLTPASQLGRTGR